MKLLNKWSIRKNLTFLVLLSILPALAILLYSGIEQRRVLIENAEREVLLMVHTMAEVQRNMTHSTRQMLATLALLPEVKTLDGEACNELFRSILENNSDYRNIALVAMNGEVLASGLPFGKTNLSDRKHVREAITKKDFAVGEFVTTRIGTTTPAFPFAYPVLDSSGTQIAVLTTAMNLAFYSRFHDVESLPEQSFISIIDHQGLRLFYYPPQPTTNPIGQPIKAAGWKSSQRKEESGLYTGISSDGIKRLYAFEKVRLTSDDPPYMYFWTAVPEQHLVASANVALLRNLLFMLLTTATVFVITWIGSSKTFIAPINQLMDMTQAFATGNLDLPTEQPETASELGKLTQSFYAMAQRLKKSTHEWTLAMDAFEDAIYLLDINRHLIRANKAFYQLLKTTPEQAVGRHIVALTHPQGETDPCSVCLAQEKKQDFVMIMEAADGDNPTGRPIELTGKIIHDSAGSPTGILMILHGLTHSRLNEQQLRESELKYRLLADYTFDWEAWIDPQGNYIYVSPACERITGYTPQEFMSDSKVLFALVPPEQREKILQHYQAEHNPEMTNHVMEFPIIAKNGETHWIEHHCTPVFDKQGNYAGRRINNRDITDRKHAEAAQQDLEIQIRQKHKMEAVGYLAGGMAHNFNNNLSIILGNVELSQMKLAPGSEVMPLLENAKTAVRRARDLVRKIITYSRKGIQHKVPTQLTAIIDETLDMLHATLPTTVHLQKIYSPDCGAKQISADAAQIQEVLLNLCNNAVQAMDEKGELKITLEPVNLEHEDIPAQYDCSPGHYFKLSVQDSGCGIPAEMLDKIFDPFYTTKAAYEGAGMGLSTVQGIVAQHGGVINVSSILGQGTVFNLYFPIVEHTRIDASTAAITTLPRGTERILLVDDDELLADLGQQLLTEMGYRVSVMTESPEALKMFAANADHFDLVITDQTMPQLSGKELIAELKKIRPDIPTILCTGYSSKINEEDAKQLGISAFMLKPLDLASLTRTIRRVLEKNGV